MSKTLKTGDKVAVTVPAVIKSGPAGFMAQVDEPVGFLPHRKKHMDAHLLRTALSILRVYIKAATCQPELNRRTANWMKRNGLKKESQ